MCEVHDFGNNQSPIFIFDSPKCHFDSTPCLHMFLLPTSANHDELAIFCEPGKWEKWSWFLCALLMSWRGTSEVQIEVQLCSRHERGPGYHETRWQSVWDPCTFAWSIWLAHWGTLCLALCTALMVCHMAGQQKKDNLWWWSGTIEINLSKTVLTFYQLCSLSDKLKYFFCMLSNLKSKIC